MNTNPFVTVGLGRAMTREELTRALRQDLVTEQESIILYEAHSQATNDPSTQAVLAYIVDDEKEHAAMLERLLEHLSLLTVRGRKHTEFLLTGKPIEKAVEFAPSEPFTTEGDAEFPGGSFIAAEPVNEDLIDDAGSLGGLKGRGMI
jgi:hypothetical protein